MRTLVVLSLVLGFGTGFTTGYLNQNNNKIEKLEGINKKQREMLKDYINRDFQRRFDKKNNGE